MNTEPKLSLDEAKTAASTKPFPKVTESFIKGRIAAVDYLYKDILTICVITHKNGFMVHGVAAAVDVRNHDTEIGKRYAYDNAFKQFWQLEGFLLREDMWLSHLGDQDHKDAYEIYSRDMYGKYRPT